MTLALTRHERSLYGVSTEQNGRIATPVYEKMSHKKGRRRRGEEKRKDY